MGYRCPVCATPQADGVHLANHLAITALARGGDHEAWLDDRAPGWAEMGPDGLAAAVTDHAEKAVYPTIFEDTVGEHRGREQVGPGEHGRPADETTRGVLEAARELTRQREEQATNGDSSAEDGS